LPSKKSGQIPRRDGLVSAANSSQAKATNRPKAMRASKQCDKNKVVDLGAQIPPGTAKLTNRPRQADSLNKN